MPEVPLFIVDAFAERAFEGNPAGVCLLEGPRPDAVLQAIAAEMNLSETAFVYPTSTDTFSLRWFTPKVEMPLCGHATLATAAVLFESKTGAGKRLRFQTLSGELTAERDGDAVRLDFPRYRCAPLAAPKPLLDALGIPAPENVEYSPESKKLLVEVGDAAAVKAVAPEYERLRAFSGPPEVRGVVVTAKGERDVDFVSRYFAPWVGINEDPVTGAAHCLLATYWGERLKKTELRARQVSARGGTLRLRRDGDRVHLVGKAIVTLRGKLQVPD